MDILDIAIGIVLWLITFVCGVVGAFLPKEAVRFHTRWNRWMVVHGSGFDYWKNQTGKKRQEFEQSWT